MLIKGELKTLKDIIVDKCVEYKDNVCFLEKNKVTKKFEEKKYSELKDDVISLSTALYRKFGLLNQKVAVIGENSYKWFVSYMAVTTGVGVVVPLDKELPAEEILNLLKRSGAKCIIYSSKKSEVIDQIKNEIQKSVEKDMMFIEMDKERSDSSSYSYDEVVKIGKELVELGENWYFENEVDRNEMRLLMFTSGTTAKSKGVMLCHRNIISNLDGATEMMRVDSNDRFFSILPMHHIYEMVVTCIYAIANGSSVAICEGLKYIAQDIKITKPTILVCVPLLVEYVCKKIDKTLKESNKKLMAEFMVRGTDVLDAFGIHLKRKIFDQIHESLGGRLRYILVSAAPIEKRLIKQIEGYGYIVYQGYGLTETTSLVSGTRAYDKKRTGTVGTPSSCEVKIEKINGSDEGEILVKGDNVMLGYYKDEEATRSVIIDGWFHTGDLAHFNKDGNIVITGRCKNVIVTNNGKNIFPEELENEINKIKGVKESMVYGDGEGSDMSICAIVTLDEEELKEFYGETVPDDKDVKNRIWEGIKAINKKMVPYKAIKKLKTRNKDFEKTTTLKIKRFLESNKEEILEN